MVESRKTLRDSIFVSPALICTFDQALVEYSSRTKKRWTKRLQQMRLHDWRSRQKHGFPVALGSRLLCEAIPGFTCIAMVHGNLRWCYSVRMDSIQRLEARAAIGGVHT